MDNLSKRLNCKIDVYAKVEFENKLKEKDYKYEVLKSVYSEIIPAGGSMKSLQGGEDYADVTHKITIRNNSIPGLTNDMYFMYKGQRFDINFTQPNFKFKNSIEIMCNLVVQ